MTNAFRYLLILIAALTISFGFVCFGTYSDANAAVGEKSVIIPSDQQQFITIINNSKKKHASAKNDLQKKLYKNEMNTELVNIYRKKGIKIMEVTMGLIPVIKEDSVVDWVGTIKDLSLTDSGDAHVEIELKGGKHITVANLNDFKMDIQRLVFSLIGSSKPLFRKVAAYSVGDSVKFTGSFYHQIGQIQHISYLEEHAMGDLYFLFQFSDIEKI